MGWLGWIVIGAIAGWIASKITKNDAGMGILANIIAGVIGGLVGGFVFNAIGGSGITGFNIWSLFVAIVGSVIVLAIYNLIRGRGARG
ncbi:MAG: GlsB/YeaQ/YmgE family stress response membrane protein [Clostridiaceae bacterium]|jgi:uncharacterized membrane protein YeaQ/YmgE (transglycosylase-associated protein family)|nr:GlsB/YeaQ/YmgE family stress response membrane protein [Bacillota bacterium]NLN51618.1 GlsB/YeaQ/YmgE family stress response membrane protein [Clostridiaceae bacterium]